MESRSVKSSRTVFFSSLAKTLDFLISFATRTIFIKVFGVSILGISGLFSNVVTFLCLADLGFGTAMTYSYYKPIAEDDKERIAQLNKFYHKVYLIIAAIVLIIGIALIPFLPQIINLKEPVDHLYLYYVLTLSNTVVSYLFVYKSTVISAHQEGYIISKFNMVFNLIASVIRVLVMIFLKNYTIYLIMFPIFTLMNNAYVSHVANTRYPFIKAYKTTLPKAERKGIFKNVGSAFIYKLSSVLLTSTDNIIISKIVGTEVVGFYSNYLTIINAVNSYVSILFSSLTASIGNVIVKESSKKQFQTFKEVQMISYWCAVVLSSCVFTLFNDVITLWLGEGFELDRLTVLAICINFHLGCVLYPIWIFREAAGLYRKTKYIMVICAVINIVLSIILGKVIGLSGILFATAISKVITYVWYEPIILFRDYFNASASKFFLSLVFVTAVTIGTSALIGYVVTLIPYNGIIGFLVKGVICFIITNIIFIILYGRNEYFKTLVKRLVGLVNGFIKKKA